MPTTVLTEDLLERIHSRAPIHDRDNTFPTPDLDELKAAGYLRALVPRELGGLGLTLAELAGQQISLAAAAPATALAVNMHHVWMGAARFLHDRGDHSLDTVLTEGAAGETYAFGYSEAGNDLALLGSRTAARPDRTGGYSFHGRKIFTSLSPAWTRLGVHGLDDTSPDGPRIVHAFLRREDGGVEVLDDWDTLGMRATQSCTTLLDGAPARVDRVIRRLPPGPSLDPLVVAIFVTFETLLASVYTGIAERALELAVAAVHRRTSLKNDGLPLAADPDIRRRLANAALALDGIRPQIDAVANDAALGADHGSGWFRMAAGLKVRATETAKDVVDAAIRAAGGSTYFAGSELGRLHRDVLAGIFHPSDDDSTHSTVADSLLGPRP